MVEQVDGEVAEPGFVEGLGEGLAEQGVSLVAVHLVSSNKIR